jgi:hypothetical protein
VRGKPSNFTFSIDEEVPLEPVSLPDYRENPLRKREGQVHAILAGLTEADARSLLASLLDFFGLNEFSVPLPPSGLPGTNEQSFDEDTMRAIGLGIAYLRALADDQPRRRLNLWNEATAMLSEYKKRGLDEFLNQPDIEIRYGVSKPRRK